MLKLKFLLILIFASLNLVIYSAGKKEKEFKNVKKEYLPSRFKFVAEKLKTAAEKAKTNVIIKKLEKAVQEKLLDKNSATHLNINYQDADGLTPLMYAISKNDKQFAQALINSGANLNIADNSGRTALIYATYAGNKDLVKLILQAGYEFQQSKKIDKYSSPEIKKIKLTSISQPNIDFRDSSGRTALLWAIESAEEDIANLLLTADANPNIADNDGLTPLMVAAQKNLKDIVELILKRKEILENLNAQDRHGRTALIHAVANGNIDIINLLLKAKARILIKDSNGNTALEIAKNRFKAFGKKSGQQERFIEIIKILEKANEDLKKSSEKIFNYVGHFYEGFPKDYFKKIEDLLKHEEIDLNIKNYYEWTPLAFVLTATTVVLPTGKNPNVDILEIFLKNSADPNLPARYNEWPLMITEYRPYIDLLIKYGANINQQMIEGWPQGASVLTKYVGDPELLKFYLDHGANPFLKNEKGTALDWANHLWKDNLELRSTATWSGEGFKEHENYMQKIKASIQILEDYMKKYKKNGGKKS